MAFDTLAYAQRLKAAGVAADQAEAHAQAVRDAVTETTASKADLESGLARLDGRIDLLDERIQASEARLDERIQASEVRTDERIRASETRLDERTTALVAAGFAVSDAKAADPIALSLGGYTYWAGFFADYDADNTGDVAIRQEGEVHFKGSTVLDNGLEVGVRIELEGETDGDQIDESWAYVSGSFGTLRVGNDDPAAIQLATAAPYPDYIFNGNSPYFSPSGAFLTTFPYDSDAASVIYFTPALGGLSVGVSYAPEGGDADGNIEARAGGGASAYARAMDSDDQVASVGIRYDGSMGMDMGIAAAAGWTQFTDNEDGMNVGLSLSMGSFAVGGSYMDREVDTGTDPEPTYDVGATYSDGPMTLGVSWITQDMNADLYRLQLAYDLGAGVSVNSAIGIDQPEADNDDTTFVGTSLIIGF